MKIIIQYEKNVCEIFLKFINKRSNETLVFYEDFTLDQINEFYNIWSDDFNKCSTNLIFKYNNFIIEKGKLISKFIPIFKNDEYHVLIDNYYKKNV